MSTHLSYFCSLQALEPGESSVTFLTPLPRLSSSPFVPLWSLRANFSPYSWLSLGSRRASFTLKSKET